MGRKYQYEDEPGRQRFNLKEAISEILGREPQHTLYWKRREINGNRHGASVEMDTRMSLEKVLAEAESLKKQFPRCRVGVSFRYIDLSPGLRKLIEKQDFDSLGDFRTWLVNGGKAHRLSEGWIHLTP